MTLATESKLCRNPDRPGCLGPRVPGSDLCRPCMQRIALHRRGPTPVRLVTTPATPVAPPAGVATFVAPSIAEPTYGVSTIGTRSDGVQIETQHGPYGPRYRWRRPGAWWSAWVGSRRQLRITPLDDRANAILTPPTVVTPPAAVSSAEPVTLTYVEMILLAAIELPDGFTFPDLAVATWKAFPTVFSLGSHPHPDSNRVASKVYGATGLVGRGFIDQVSHRRFRVTALGRARAQGGTP
jgi:hypothetical protein